MLTRKYYLKEPEKWFGTEEELELVNVCLRYINETNIPKGEEKVVLDGREIIFVRNVAGMINLTKLSIEVLNVYNGNRKGNKKS